MKTKGFTKRMLSWVMALVMVCSIMTGVTINSPAVVAEAAVSRYTTPITEKASEEEATTWKFLFVVPLTAVYKDETTDLQGDTLSAEDIELFKTYIVPNFEAAIESYSLGYMKVESTIVTIDTLVADKCAYNAYGYWPTSTDVKAALEAGTGVTAVKGTLADLEEYDQICCGFAPDNTTNPEKSLAFNAAGLGGPRFADLKSGYTITRLAKGMDIQDHNKGILEQGFNIKEDGTLDYFYFAELIVHEFIHCLEYWVKYDYPEHIRREMPTPDGCWDYYKYRDGFNLMNEFYIHFFRGNIPVAKGSSKKWGMTVADYANNPAKYQGVEIGEVTVKTLDEWNELCNKVAFGADTSKATITLGANIDATGKDIYTIPSFKGTLDGAGYAIIGASLTGTGLIGTVEQGATVKNLLLMGATITNKEAYATGLIAGENSGTITGCGVTGTVTGGTYAGGIVGKNNVVTVDEVETKATVSNCFNGAVVNATKYIAGGIVGWNDGYVGNCYNYGDVTAKEWGASIAYSENKGTIKNCYNLQNKATDDADNSGKAEIITSEEMASDKFVIDLNGGGSAFAKGNGYPVLSGTKYTYMTTGGSTKALADENTEVDALVWAGGTATKLVTTLKATKWVNSSNKKVSGTITWIIKNEPTEIEFNETTHKVTTKSDTTIATVSKGTVKGKTEGRAYVYAIDTGSMTAEVFVVQVKAAPSAMATYYEPVLKTTEGSVTSAIASDTVKYTSDIVPDGGSVKLYYAGSMGTAKKGTWEHVIDEDLTYTLTVPAKYQDYITVTEDTENDSFAVTVKEGTFEKFSKKNKAFTVSLTIKNDQTGKKATFKVVVSNPVKTIELTADEGTTLTKDEGNGVMIVTLDSAATEVKTAIIKENVKLYDEDGTRTDSTKIVRIPHPDQYDFSATSAITLVGKTSADQNKVSLAAVKGQPGQYKITAKKGTQPGTEAYFVIWHNSFGRTNGTGYQIVKVVVGEANHAKSLKFEKTAGNDINKEVIIAREGGTSNYVVKMPSAKTAAEAAYLTETITLTNTAEGAVGTDYSTIYKLPCGTTDAFTIAKNGVVTVNGALSAAQKKVSMAAVKGKTGEFKINAAKGTPEGTEAYFLLYHNPEVYSIISVTVGDVNKVVKSELAKDAADASKAELSTETLGEGNMTVISVPYSTAKQTVVLKETKTAKDTANTTITDANKVLRMAKADGYEVALNKSTVTAVGALSAAQKKISAAYKKGSTEIINVTVAAKAPVGTETYFIIYHNDETEGSGTGYHIVKVVVTEAEAAE